MSEINQLKTYTFFKKTDLRLLSQAVLLLITISNHEFSVSHRFE